MEGPPMKGLRDAENSNVVAGLIAGGVAVAVLGMFIALR